MTREKLLATYEGKLYNYLKEFQEAQSDSQIREIAFGSAGNLSKASKGRLDRHREKIGRLLINAELMKVAIKLTRGEEFHLDDLEKIARDFLGNRNPEYQTYFYTGYFRLAEVTEMLGLIFEIYQLPYRKQLCTYKMKYRNQHDGLIEISLK